jgi:hypothetical protein
MYILSPDDMAEFDLANASRFVKFWSQFYNYHVTVFETKTEIDYFSELNLGNDLTAENVRRLLRWKDPRLLTERILTGPNEGQDNPRVAPVLNCLGTINQFRNDQIGDDDMRHAAAEVFPHGIVWRAFLLHIAKPHSCPIADQNVFRAWSLHTGRRDEQTWETYAAYCQYFWHVAEAVGASQAPQTIENLCQLKRIDNALFVFGKFLKAYHPNLAHIGE